MKHREMETVFLALIDPSMLEFQDFQGRLSFNFKLTTYQILSLNLTSLFSSLSIRHLILFFLRKFSPPFPSS